MYSRKIIERNILRAEQVIKETHNLPARWTLKPPTTGERDEMRAHFNELLDRKGFLTRPFTREETLWVLIESTFCKLDFLYFARNYAKILDWEAKISLFEPNIAQMMLLNLMAENEERRVASMLMVLKARRLGLTTISQLLLGHRVFFWENVAAYTGSAEEQKSVEMVKMIEFLWQHMPYWLRPRETSNAVGDRIEYADNNSAVIVQWGNQKQGIGRGATPTIAHMSEVSSYTKPVQLIDASLAKAILENPFGFMIMESTANGLGDWWNLTWDHMVEMDTKGLAKYQPVFLPWYVGVDLYPSEAGYRRRPAPDDWVIPNYVEKHAEAAKAYVQANKILARNLGADWEMSRRQKWWYYLEFEEARKRKQLHVLLQELPASADEAFQNANPSVFSLETMIEVRTETRTHKPLGSYQISGASIPYQYSDQHIIGPSIEARCVSHEGVLLDTFNLDPVEVDRWPDPSTELKLYIWEWPQEGETYGIYCDPAEGVGRDNSVVGVIKKATPWHPDEQVAEWASNQVAPHDLWAYIFCLAHLYTVRAHDGGWVEPLVVIETNLAAGDAAQTEMLKRGYGNFYRQMDFTAIGETGAEFNKRPRAVRDKIGWKTDRYNRPRLISLFRKLVRDGNFKVRSPELAKEMGTLEYNVDKKRIQAAENEHDDRVMGAGIMLCAWYDPEVYGTVPTAFVEQRQFEEAVTHLPTYMGDKVIGKGTKRMEFVPDKTDSRIYG